VVTKAPFTMRTRRAKDFFDMTLEQR